MAPPPSQAIWNGLSSLRAASHSWAQDVCFQHSNGVQHNTSLTATCSPFMKACNGLGTLKAFFHQVLLQPHQGHGSNHALSIRQLPLTSKNWYQAQTFQTMHLVCRLLREDMCASINNAARAFLGAGGLQGLQRRDGRTWDRRSSNIFTARVEGHDEVDMVVYRKAAVESVKFDRKEGAFFQVNASMSIRHTLPHRHSC